MYPPTTYRPCSAITEYDLKICPQSTNSIVSFTKYSLLKTREFIPICALLFRPCPAITGYDFAICPVYVLSLITKTCNCISYILKEFDLGEHPLTK